jgi:hypothetical protein
VALIGGIMALLCLGGAAVVITIYDKATAIKRTEPTAVVDNFLGAYFVDRNNDDAALYLCKSGANITSLASFRASLLDREKKTGTSVVVGWKDMTATSGDKTRTVSVVLTVDGVVDSQPISGSEHPWTFGMVDDGGWRICTAMAGP